jgi:mono/diheme cytochrome c family protein
MTNRAQRIHAGSWPLRASLSALAFGLCTCSVDVDGNQQDEQRPRAEAVPEWNPAKPAEPGPALGVTPELDAGAQIDPYAPPGPDAENDAGATGACAQSAQRWLEIARANCAACHGPNSPGRAGFSSVLDVGALIASGKVVPGAPDASPLYLKLSSGQMPPPARTQRPSPADIADVKSWIECGAPVPDGARCEAQCTSFVDIDARLDLMHKDVLALATPEERTDVRYLDLSNYANAGHGDAAIELYRGALSYLVNSLSNGPKIAPPQVIDAQGLLFRIRLSDYGWSAATWERIAADYPYRLRYDPSSRAFPHDEGVAEALRARTGTATPYLQADWFFSHASRPPLYYDILAMPADLTQLQSQLALSIQGNIDGLRAARAGFADSGPSRYNRVIERHTISEERGGLWLTYDFSAGSGNSNVLTHPLDFLATSNEILFNLPNGLQAYMITNAQGQRLDKAPNGAVQDPLAPDLAIEAGISCISCHADQGILARDDEVRVRTPLSTTDLGVLERVYGLYVEKPTLDEWFAEDKARYLAARTATRPRSFADGSAHKLNDAYRGLMKTADVAGALGIEERALTASIDATPRVFPPEIAALRSGAEGLARDAFEAVFVSLAAALGLGQAPP